MTAPVKTAVTDLEVVRAALDQDYDVTGELGRGGMAMVFRARERQLDREVAIKVLPFALAFDAELVERFQREARVAAGLEHPHIVPIYRVGRSGQVIYFVMKLLRGESLSARIAQRGPLPAAEVRRVLAETASALGYAHRRGVVHRDVKPDNIMLDEDGHATVTDFGIARSAADTKLTAAGMSLGTPRYMSPEQARARDVDGRSDLYSLGVVGYECIAGRPPFDEGDAVTILMDHVQAPVPRPARAAAGSADERGLYAVVERLLAKTPEGRYASAEALIGALDGTGGAATPSSAAAGGAAGGAAGDELTGRAPQSSAALDSALDAGLEMLKQQRPKVEAGIAAGRRLVDANAPRVKAVAAQTAHHAEHGAARLAAAVAPRARTAGAWVGSRGARFWKLAAGGAAGCWLAYAVGGFALNQRSRCPAPSAAQSGVADSANPAAPGRRTPFTVLLDSPGSIRQGSDLDVYYDVCGLDEGLVKTRITVARNESGIRRLFGDGVEPVSVSAENAVTGPRMRRHESIDLDEMSAGSYTVSVVARDGKGRVREADASFQVRGR